jgi:hypothetical protein
MAQIAWVSNQSDYFLRVSGNPPVKGNVCDVGPGIGSSSDIEIPSLSKYDRPSNNDLVKVLAAVQTDDGSSAWQKWYTIWQSKEDDVVHFSTRGFFVDAPPVPGGFYGASVFSYVLTISGLDDAGNGIEMSNL